jgi:hypothetical protein
MFGELVDIDDFLSNKNNVLERAGLNWDGSIVFEQNK